MLSRYESYLNYKEIRRRVEKRLKNINGLFIHGLVFFTINLILWVLFYNSSFYYWGYGIFYPGLLTTGWSWVLLFHAMRTYLMSGAWSDTRGSAIEQEMRALLDSDGGYSDHDDYFVMHRMLDEDVAQRAGFVAPLTLFAGMNAFAWVLWIAAGASYFDYAVWAFIVLAGIAIVPLGAVINFWRRNRRERRRMEENIPDLMAAKQKRREISTPQPLSDEDEEPVYTIAELIETQKKSRR
jgi:hypothetical protein